MFTYSSSNDCRYNIWTNQSIYIYQYVVLLIHTSTYLDSVKFRLPNPDITLYIVQVALYET